MGHMYLSLKFEDFCERPAKNYYINVNRNSEVSHIFFPLNYDLKINVYLL